MAAHIAECDNELADHTACCKSTADEQEDIVELNSTALAPVGESNIIQAIAQ